MLPVRLELLGALQSQLVLATQCSWQARPRHTHQALPLLMFVPAQPSRLALACAAARISMVISADTNATTLRVPLERLAIHPAHAETRCAAIGVAVLDRRGLDEHKLRNKPAAAALHARSAGAPISRVRFNPTRHDIPHGMVKRGHSDLSCWLAGRRVRAKVEAGGRRTGRGSMCGCDTCYCWWLARQQRREVRGSGLGPAGRAVRVGCAGADTDVRGGGGGLSRSKRTMDAEP